MESDTPVYSGNDTGCHCWSVVFFSPATKRIRSRTAAKNKIVFERRRKKLTLQYMELQTQIARVGRVGIANFPLSGFPPKKCEIRKGAVNIC